MKLVITDRLYVEASGGVFTLGSTDGSEVPEVRCVNRTDLATELVTHEIIRPDQRQAGQTCDLVNYLGRIDAGEASRKSAYVVFNAGQLVTEAGYDRTTLILYDPPLANPRLKHEVDASCRQVIGEYRYLLVIGMQSGSTAARIWEALTHSRYQPV